MVERICNLVLAVFGLKSNTPISPDFAAYRAGLELIFETDSASRQFLSVSS
jgi:hypothetical protein